MMEVRSAQYICAAEIPSRDPSEGLQGLQNAVGQSNCRIL